MSTYIYNPSLLDNLAGKTVIVTGGAHGIGAQTVRSFHAHGMNVVVADLPSSDATAKALIASLSNSAIFIPVDLSIWADTRNLFKKTIEHFGQVDIVAANAGVMEHKAFFDFELDEDGELREPVESYRVIDVNLKGTMNSKREIVLSIII
jgi:NAD(P)-dependent dehydrogenase (short-subunit alcohol dehydrogenase family)